MSNHIRTALQGGGQISALLCVQLNGTIQLQIIENLARLTSVEKAELSAEVLNAAPDPDRLIFQELKALVEKAHIRFEARQNAPEDAAKPPEPLPAPPQQKPDRAENWNVLGNLSTPAGREAVGLELLRSFYTVRLRKRKEGKKTVISLEYKQDC